MPKKVLLVEDDAAILETLAMFLEYEGFEVAKAATLREALASAEASGPDLAIVDFMLGDETSEPAIQLLRSKYGRKVPVILLSALDNARDIGKRLSTEAVVSKPFELDGLMRVVQKTITGAHARADVVAVPKITPQTTLL